MTVTFLDASWQRRRVGKGAHLILRRACPFTGARLEGLRAVPTRSTVLVGTARETREGLAWVRRAFAHPTDLLERNAP
jgi:hypothetical protein